MRMAMVESVDLAVFKGDAGANEDTADVVGLQTAAVTEATLTIAKSKKADDVLKFFLEYVDGQYAASLSDVRIVASVGTNVLWHGSIHNSTADNQTIAQFLMASGLSWTARGGIDTRHRKRRLRRLHRAVARHRGCRDRRRVGTGAVDPGPVLLGSVWRGPVDPQLFVPACVPADRQLQAPEVRHLERCRICSSRGLRELRQDGGSAAGT